MEYLIKWKDLDNAEDNSWEPLINISGYRSLVDEFESKLLIEQNAEKNQKLMKTDSSVKTIEEPSRQHQTQEEFENSVVRAPVAIGTNKVSVTFIYFNLN